MFVGQAWCAFSCPKTKRLEANPPLAPLTRPKSLLLDTWPVPALERARPRRTARPLLWGPAQSLQTCLDKRGTHWQRDLGADRTRPDRKPASGPQPGRKPAGDAVSDLIWEPPGLGAIAIP